MKQSFFIASVLPNLNDIVAAAKVRRGAWSKYAEMKTIYGSLCKADIKAANLTPMERVRISFLWHEKNQRRDKDNITAGQKFILDALVERQILKNDGWQEIAEIRHAWIVDRKNPGVLVVMEETA